MSMVIIIMRKNMESKLLIFQSVLENALSTEAINNHQGLPEEFEHFWLGARVDRFGLNH